MRFIKIPILPEPVGLPKQSSQKQIQKTKSMKTKSKSVIHAAGQSFSGIVCAGAVLLMAASAPGQNLFVTSCINPGSNIKSRRAGR